MIANICEILNFETVAHMHIPQNKFLINYVDQQVVLNKIKNATVTVHATAIAIAMLQCIQSIGYNWQCKDFISLHQETTAS